MTWLDTEVWGTRSLGHPHFRTFRSDSPRFPVAACSLGEPCCLHGPRIRDTSQSETSTLQNFPIQRPWISRRCMESASNGQTIKPRSARHPLPPACPPITGSRRSLSAPAPRACRGRRRPVRCRRSDSPPGTCRRRSWSPWPCRRRSRCRWARDRRRRPGFA